MILFDPNKTKTISFDIEVKGINPDLLEYNIRLFNEKINWGFKGKSKNGSIVFEIPPLSAVIRSDLLEQIDGIRLEVNDRNNKYYLKPYEDTVKIKVEPVIDVSIHEDIDEDLTEEVKIDVVIKEEINIIEEEVQVLKQNLLKEF